ncbi:MAG: hypothetical protein GY869_19460 [Planctomycetes bacterium]|nr:hypothetical protein [Planctomycetota bacterium]
MRLVGIILLVALVGYGLAAGAGDKILVFLSPHSLIDILGGTGLILLIAHGRREWGEFFRFIRFKSGEMDDEAKVAVGEFLATGSRAALALGLFWELICIIIMLMNMDDPSAVGPGMAMSILPLVYGIVLSEMVFVPMHKNLMRSGPREKRKGLPQVGMYLALVANLFMLLTFFILVLSMSEVKQGMTYQDVMETIRQSVDR